MTQLQLVYAPDPIFQTKAEPIETIDDTVRLWGEEMLEIMYEHKGVGIAANMVGLLKRIIAYDLQEEGKKEPVVMVNPEILWKSEDMQMFEEASLSFPGISAQISRPNAIKVKYIDLEGQIQRMEANGWLATVIQHEIDYLDGKVYLDYISTFRRDALLKKMKQERKKLRY